jgi:hypothetical protein
MAYNLKAEASSPCGFRLLASTAWKKRKTLMAMFLNEGLYQLSSVFSVPWCTPCIINVIINIFSVWSRSWIYILTGYNLRPHYAGICIYNYTHIFALSREWSNQKYISTASNEQYIYRVYLHRGEKSKTNLKIWNSFIEVSKISKNKSGSSWGFILQVCKISTCEIPYTLVYTKITNM